MAKIAIALDDVLARRRVAGTPGGMTRRILARSDGWTVADVLCTCGPADHPFEERHDDYTIAAVVAGSFHYQTPLDHGLMTPGSMLLGNAGQCFECGHQHGEGDRCVSFWYERGYFERLACDAGARAGFAGFTAARVPALQALAPIVACASAGALDVPAVSWEELAVNVAVRTMRLAAGVPDGHVASPLNAEARVSRTVRAIDREPGAAFTLASLAKETGLSLYHFLRTFERVTGVTPYRYVRRARLREAAARLATESAKVLDVALDSGFGDVSNFNHAFRAEFGVTPRAYRRSLR